MVRCSRLTLSGIDLGSSKAVLAAVKSKGIEIVLSDSSGRAIPSVVAFTEEERLIGDSTLGQMKKNFKNTLQFFIRLLGLNSDNKEQLAEEAKYQTYKIVDLPNKKIGV